MTASATTDSPAWWPAGHGQPTFLTDASAEGRFDEWAKVPLQALGTTNAAAPRTLDELHSACLDFIRGCPYGADMLNELAAHGFELQLSEDAPTWSRPAVVREDDTWVYTDPDHPCSACQGQPTGEGPCRSCRGSGRHTIVYDDDSYPWRTCDADAPGAVEFLLLDVVDRAAK